LPRVDSDGLPVRVVVLLRRDPGRDSVGLVLDQIRKRVPRVELIWADGGYDAWQVEAAAVRRIGSTKRASRQDFENFAENSASFVTLSSIPSGGLPGRRP
jgi:hypothetical protein